MVEFRWSPGIGDPTLGGWITVFLYFAAAYFSWRVTRDVGADGGGTKSEMVVWRLLTIMFVALGINKQLDLQSAFTEIGRVVAHYQGWYENRRAVQFTFIGVVGGLCLLAALTLLAMIWKAPPATWLAAGGAILVLLFVGARAASFHHVDELINARVFGLRWNWILEMGGILLVLLAAHRRRTMIAAVR
jgi:hypothetical protein